ncbi:fimbrial biogenesis chaperone [Enterobacter asburiae]|uniref:fimbrial biogenesis chaperone n=1 Tax=Enterobacter asburiae TaxID=61645 RepID=UPI0021D25A1E|nr:molecular chaperone [Enterobacter asburiae]MCU6244086.1 molecular chaperone [Enterobacter asburiae]
MSSEMQVCREQRNRKINRGVIAAWGFCCLVASAPPAALAGGLGLGQTRVVYHEGDTSQSVTLHNAGENVYLIQASVTDKNQSTSTPVFSVLPPVFRLEPDADSVVRIVRTGGDLPRDRESVFRLRIGSIEGHKGELPTQLADKEGVGGTISLSIGFSIKVFYRPNGLSMTPEEARSKLTFSHHGNRLVIKNPTPYYLTFASLNAGGKVVDVSAGDGMQMVSPYAQTEYSLPGGMKGNRVVWTVITDSGEMSPEQKGQLN